MAFNLFFQNLCGKRLVSALETKIRKATFKVCFQSLIFNVPTTREYTATIKAIKVRLCTVMVTNPS